MEAVPLGGVVPLPYTQSEEGSEGLEQGTGEQQESWPGAAGSSEPLDHRPGAGVEPPEPPPDPHPAGGIAPPYPEPTPSPPASPNGGAVAPFY